MGVLYDVMQVKKRENVLERQKEQGIRTARDGRPLSDLTYKELIVQLAIADVIDVDVENQENKWF
jgi:hypothetical protein